MNSKSYDEDWERTRSYDLRGLAVMACRLATPFQHDRL